MGFIDTIKSIGRAFGSAVESVAGSQGQPDWAAEHERHAAEQYGWDQEQIMGVNDALVDIIIDNNMHVGEDGMRISTGLLGEQVDRFEDLGVDMGDVTDYVQQQPFAARQALIERARDQQGPEEVLAV